MTSPFPFGFPLPTAFYLTLYVVTLMIHVVFMNYVLAGSAHLAWVSWFKGGDRQRHMGPTAMVLRDWMPAAVSAAITAGVAPLLFIQILYKRDFYTANLLLFHRWMSILPVLIVGSYLSYLLKAKRVGEWPTWARAVVGVGAFACFGFVAYSWTENHLLSQEPQEFKSAFYASGSMLYHSPQLLPRLGAWFIGAFAAMATIVGWQLCYLQRHGREVPRREFGRLGILAIVGTITAGVCGGFYFTLAAPLGLAVITGPMALPYTVTAVVGAILVIVGWAMAGLGKREPTLGLALASVGCVLMILGATVVREALRLSSVDLPSLYPKHAQAARVGGLVVFLAFFVINAILIGCCFRYVRKGRVRST